MSSKSNVRGWLLLGLFALLALSIFLWFSNQNLKAQINNQNTEMVELEKVQAELDRDYQNALESIEALRDDNENLDELIDNQKNELKEQKKKIDNLIWSKRELSKARDEISNLRDVTADYIIRINDLKADNEKLTQSNLTLRKDNEDLTVNLIQEQARTKELEDARVALANTKVQLEQQAEILSKKTDIGSAVKINYMEVTGYQLKDDNSLKKKKKAKNIDVLRICFRTETNMVTEPGNETFRIRYVDKAGQTATGSGDTKSLINKLTEEELLYSAEGDIAYNNRDTEGCIDWVIGSKLEKGEYDVQMFNKGYPVGKGNFKLK